MKLDEARAALNAKKENVSNKVSKLKSPGIGWEIGAYAVRAVSVAAPASIVMTLENSWVKNGLGLLATFVIIALLLIFKKPIEKASNYAPGVIVFAIFVIIAIFFKTVSDVLLTVGISGLAGCGAATPLHMKYLSKQEQQKSPELIALETIADKVSKLK